MKKSIATAGLLLAASAWGQAGTQDPLASAVRQADSTADSALVDAGTSVKGLGSTGFAPRPAMATLLRARGGKE